MTFTAKSPYAGYRFPAEVLRWAEGLPTVHEDAQHFYVHAGFRPGRPGPDPSEHVRLWIREPFLSRDYDFGKHVVHGHTPLRTAQPDQRPFRTNLDTGAVFGGPLTAGVFTNDQAHAVEFLQVCEAKPSVARHPVRDAAAAVVSDHGKALEPERVHDRDLPGGHGGLAAARFHP